MNGRRAKKLRKMSRLILTNVMKEDLGTGYNEYNQARNCVSVVPAIDPETGTVRVDGDGKAMTTVSTTEPGTITCAWKLRILYSKMKRRVRDARMPVFSTFKPKLTRRQRKADARSLRLKQRKRDAEAGPGRDGGPEPAVTA